MTPYRTAIRTVIPLVGAGLAAILTLPVSSSAATAANAQGTFYYNDNRTPHPSPEQLRAPMTSHCYSTPQADSPKNRTNAQAALYSDTACVHLITQLSPGVQGSDPDPFDSVEFR